MAMSRRFKIHNQQEVYFVTFTVLNWIDVFTRDDYRQIIVESLKYCQQNKGLRLFAWCIMTNHVHLIVGSDGINRLEFIIRDLKSYTSRQIRLCMKEHPAESRKEWMLWFFTRAGIYNSNNIDWQLWQQHSHPIELSNGTMAKQRLDYLHNNPVKAGFVFEPQHWKWSSAYDYCGGKGLIEVMFIE
jgi:putative transposase